MRRKYGWIFGAAMLILIFVRPQEAVDGAQRAMRTWFTGVAPAMLPFLALMPMITAPEACAAYQKLFSGIMNRLFKLPGAAAPAVIAAMISGSPGGSAVIYEMKAGGGISNTDAARIALAVGGVSPGWLVLGVGCGMLGSKAAGLKFAAIQIVVQLFLLKLLEKVKIENAPGSEMHQPKTANRQMWSAVETVLGVCGYMAVFGAYGNVLASFAGKTAGTVLMSVLDLPSGVGMISDQIFRGRYAAIGAAIGFGGLCIAAQNVERIRSFGIRWMDYLFVRLISAILNGGLCAVAFRNMRPEEVFRVPHGKIYVISLLAAGIFTVPGMIFLSKNIFLNKRKGKKNNAEICQKPN